VETIHGLKRKQHTVSSQLTCHTSLALLGIIYEIKLLAKKEERLRMHSAIPRMNLEFLVEQHTKTGKLTTSVIQVNVCAHLEYRL